MALRQIISKIILPNIERDLTKVIGSEFASVDIMTDTMLAPHVYGYESTATNNRAFAKTEARNARVQEERLVRISYPAPEKGMFN
jgi:hypothetical protein